MKQKTDTVTINVEDIQTIEHYASYIQWCDKNNIQTAARLSLEQYARAQHIKDTDIGL